MCSKSSPVLRLTDIDTDAEVRAKAGARVLLRYVFSLSSRADRNSFLSSWAASRMRRLKGTRSGSRRSGRVALNEEAYGDTDAWDEIWAEDFRAISGNASTPSTKWHSRDECIIQRPEVVYLSFQAQWWTNFSIAYRNQSKTIQINNLKVSIWRSKNN